MIPTMKIYVLMVAVIIGAFALSLFTYPSLPEQMITHWNSQGQPDGSMGKLAGAFLIPVLMAVLLSLLVLLPKIDPLKKNYSPFKVEYEWFIVALLVFMMAIHGYVILWNKGYFFSIISVMGVSMAFLMVSLSSLIRRSKQNWFVGIRTPWTLSSVGIWNETHALAGKLLWGAGVICLVSILVPRYALWLILGAVLFATIVPAIYSYVLFRRKKQ